MATNLIDVELQSPFQNQPIGATGLDLGETSIAKDPFKFGEKVAQIDVGRQFGQLLDKGQEGMIATANALISEGTFTAEELQGLDPNLPAFQSEKGQIAWYSGIKAKIDAKAKAKAEAERQALGETAFSEEGTRADRTKFAIKSGLSPEKLFDQFTDEEKTVFTQDINQDFQDTLAQEGISEASTTQDLIDFVERFVKRRPEVASHPAFITLKETIEGGLDRDAKEAAAAASATGRQGRQEKISFRKYITATAKMTAVVTAINAIDKALPGGIDNPTGEVFGVLGIGSSKLRDFVMSEKGVKLRQAINTFFQASLKEQSGVAVSDREFDRVTKTFGLNTRGNVDAFIQSMKISRDQRKDTLKTWQLLLTDEQLERVKSGGGITAESLPSEDKPRDDEPKEVKTELTSKSSDADIKKWLKENNSKTSEANIKNVRKQLEGK
jgi:hypothetical protein